MTANILAETEITLFSAKGLKAELKTQLIADIIET